MNHKECIKRKTKLQTDLSLISESELSIAWGISVHSVREEAKRLKIKIRSYAGEERFYSRQQCNSRLSFLNKDHAKEESGSISDELIARKDLLKRFNMNEGQFSAFIVRYGIYAVKTQYIYGKRVSFFRIDQCDKAMQKELYRHKSRGDAMSDKKLVTVKQLAEEWNETVNNIYPFLRKNNICAQKTITSKNNVKFYNRAECERARPFINQPEKKEVKSMEAIDNTTTATKYQILSETGADDFVWDKVTMKHKIMPVKNYCDERGNFVSLFKKDEAVSAILAYKSEQKQLLEKCLADKSLVTTKDLVKIWKIDYKSVSNKIYKMKIKPYAKIKLENNNFWHFYKKSDCIETQDVEQVEQNELPEIKPEPTETTPDIIPADTIDLFTMSELESELKNRGVELTQEVKAKINASDMPEMQHIATMLRGNAKTIAIRLSVLNEIAEQLRIVEHNGKNELLDEIGKPRVLWLSVSERIVFEFLRNKASYTPKIHIIEHMKNTRRYMYTSDAAQSAWAAISSLRNIGCLDAKDGCFMINSDYISTETMRNDISNRKTTEPMAIDIGLENGKQINEKIKKYGWWTIGIIAEVSGKSESWLRSYLPAEDCLIEYGSHRLIKAWRPNMIIKWLNNRNIFVQGWGAMAKYSPNGMRKYNSEFDKIAFDMASRNKSDIEISKRLDISLETFNKYKKEIPSFANAINSGMADYISLITSSQVSKMDQENKYVCINKDIKDKLRFMAMADNVDLIKKLESIIMAAWIMGNYENK